MQKHYLLFDTETVDVSDLSIFDIGFIVFNESYEIVHKQRLVFKEIVDNEERFKKCYYYSNKDFYKDLEKHEYPDLKITLNKLIKEYNIKGLFAFNIDFDIRSLHYTFKRYELSKDGIDKTKLKKHGIELYDIIDIFLMNVDIKKYTKYCLEKNFITEKGNIKYTAEVINRYILNRDDVVETHTALEDCEIEFNIINHVRTLDGFDINKKLPTKAYLYLKQNQ